MTSIATTRRRGGGRLIPTTTCRSRAGIGTWLLRFTILGIALVTFRQIYLQQRYHYDSDYSTLLMKSWDTLTVPTPRRRRIDGLSNNNNSNDDATSTRAGPVKASPYAKEEEESISSSFSYSAFTYPNKNSPQPLPYVYEADSYESRHSIFTADSARERRGDDDLASIGDPLHLGGFDILPSNQQFSPSVFKHLIEEWGVRSVVDVGCGRGWAVLWFLTHGIDNVIGIDGSPAASKKSVLKSLWQNHLIEQQRQQKENETASSLLDPLATITTNSSSLRSSTSNNNTDAFSNDHSHHIEHDYTNGPWWTSDTIDLVWSTSFVQQVSLQYMPNYVSTFSKAAIVVITVPQDAGWHHVEIHEYNYWVRRMKYNGFDYDDDLTQELRHVALDEFVRLRLEAPDRGHYAARSLWTDLLVFTNPRIIGLPRHNLHLFPQFGCVRGKITGEKLQLRECGTMAGKLLESKLDPNLYPLKLHEDMDVAFDKLVQKQMKLDKNASSLSSSGRYDHPLLVDDLPPGPPVSIADHPIHKVKQQALSRTYTWISASLRKPSSSNANSSLSIQRIPVVIWPYIFVGADPMNAEARHVNVDGVNESPYLSLSRNIFNFNPGIVWIGDTSDAGDREWDAFCMNFLEIINKARKKRSENGLPLSWPIYIVDWTDYPMPMRCRIIETVMGQEFVKYSHRSIVKDRKWNSTENWVDVGTYLSTEKFGGGNNIKYKHTPLTVRTDTVIALDQILKAWGLDLSYPIAELPRDIDVTHLWPRDGKYGVGVVESKLRTKISGIVSDMAEQASSNNEANATTTTTPLKVYVGLAGLAVRDGRRSVMAAYVERLLQSKIVIVSQRDSWEDHYRLFEALVAGPLVLLDKMLSLPAELEHGISVVEFTSEQDLRNKIMYYVQHPQERVAIASEGRRIAMSRHRSWHRMEEIIFDTPLSRCSQPLSQEEKSKNHNSQCPYTLHATLS